MRAFRLGVLVVGAFASSCGSGNDDSACDVAGCGPVATIKTDLGLAFADLRKAKITVCHNDTCLAGSFDSLNAPPSPNAGVQMIIGDEPDGGAAAFTTYALVMANASGVLWLQVLWRSGVDAIAAGDNYSVSVVDANGRSVVSFMGTATTYDTVYPNGKDCAPSCQSVVFDQHTS